MKSVKFNPLTSLVMAAALAIGLAACGGSSSTTTAMPEPEPEPMPAPPTDLEETQMAAKAAADAAMASSDAAADSASDAADATMNIADIQTGESAIKAAMDARKYADMAMGAYMDAKKASDAAAGAATGDAAEAAWRDAVTAQEAAEEAAMMADEKAKAAVAAAMMEVMVDGSTKSVGDTSIAIDGKTVTSGDPVVTTGKQMDDISAMSMMVAAVPAVVAVNDDDTTMDIDESMAAVVAKPTIAPRPIDIGFVYDSPDDSARVRLVTQYIGSGTVAGVYTGDGETSIMVAATAHAAYDHDGTDTDASPPVRILKASGMFYEATTSVGADGTVPATVGTDDDERANKGTPLYYYDVVTRNADGAVTDRTRTWLLRTGTLTAADGTETHNYTPYTTVNVATTLKNFPMAMAFGHLHYGVWNSLDEKGMAIDDLGTGFVTATEGSKMSGSDMPNAGTAEYNGQWVASVRGSGGGAITAQSGDSKLMADFAEHTVEVELMSLATLEGMISGDRFSGTKVSGVMSDKGDLAVSADGSKFEGSFSGGFYGAKAAEAGGVFDYTSTDMTDGEFRGAFGGAKKEE